MRGDEAAGGRDAIDGRIDAALRSYAEPGEIPEARVVLARVMERAGGWESRRRGWWMWGAVAAAGLAVVMAVGVMWVMRSPRGAEIAWVPKAAGSAVMGTAESSAPDNQFDDGKKKVHGTAEALPRQNRGTTRRASQTEAESLPKRDVFPTPRPLSAEERALVAFANDVPGTIQQQVIEAQRHVGDPIAIAELKIAPPNGGEKQGFNEQERNRER